VLLLVAAPPEPPLIPVLLFREPPPPPPVDVTVVIPVPLTIEFVPEPPRPLPVPPLPPPPTTNTSTFPVNVYTSSANTFGTIAEFYNGDFTAGARTFIRVRNQISAGSTMSSYFGQGQDGKTYIIANNSARGGDIVIDGNSGNTTFAANVLPAANGTQDLGSTSLRWGTIYTSDLSLNNGIGDWTIVEGEDDLFLYNNKKGKVYKFALTEVDPNVATPKNS
jgi:hypothetical protein